MSASAARRCFLMTQHGAATRPKSRHSIDSMEMSMLPRKIHPSSPLRRANSSVRVGKNRGLASTPAASLAPRNSQSNSKLGLCCATHSCSGSTSRSHIGGLPWSSNTRTSINCGRPCSIPKWSFATQPFSPGRTTLPGSPPGSAERIMTGISTRRFPIPEWSVRRQLDLDRHCADTAVGALGTTALHCKVFNNKFFDISKKTPNLGTSHRASATWWPRTRSFMYWREQVASDSRGLAQRSFGGGLGAVSR